MFGFMKKDKEDKEKRKKDKRHKDVRRVKEKVSLSLEELKRLDESRKSLISKGKKKREEKLPSGITADYMDQFRSQLGISLDKETSPVDATPSTNFKLLREHYEALSSGAGIQSDSNSDGTISEASPVHGVYRTLPEEKLLVAHDSPDKKNWAGDEMFYENISKNSFLNSAKHTHHSPSINEKFYDSFVNSEGSDIKDSGKELYNIESNEIRPNNSSGAESIGWSHIKFFDANLELPTMLPKEEAIPRTLCIYRSNMGDFGFSLRRAIVTEYNGPTSCVRKTIVLAEPGLMGKANQTGLLPGDRLIEVNGISVEDMSRDEIIQLIKNSGEYVRVVVKPVPELSELSARQMDDGTLLKLDSKNIMEGTLKRSGTKKRKIVAKSEEQIEARQEWLNSEKVWLVHRGGFCSSFLKTGSEASSVPEGKVLLMIEHNQDLIEADEEDVENANPPSLDLSEDLAQLKYLNESSILHCLRQRYGSSLIHTYAGQSMLIMNPTVPIAIYSEKVIQMFRGCNHDDMPPHIYAVAQSAYHDMISTRKDQSIVFVGRSGAGKTTNFRHVLHYFALASASPSPILTVERLNAISTLVEAFGNGRTLLNTNATRYTQTFTLDFDAAGQIISASVEISMPEMMRVVRRPDGEPNYHIFYQLLSGADEDLRDFLELRSLSDPNFLMTPLQRIEDRQKAGTAWARICAAFDVIKASKDEQKAIWRVLAAIYHLGTAGKIKALGNGSFSFENPTSVQKAAKLLGTSIEELSKVMFQLSTRSVIRSSPTSDSPSHVSNAFDALEGMVCGLYYETFNAVVALINRCIFSVGVPKNSIMVIDAPGSQNPASVGRSTGAGLGDLCHNYVQERLQMLFHDTTFVSQANRYEEESIDCPETLGDLGTPGPLLSLLDKPKNSSDVRTSVDNNEDERTKGLLWMIDEESLYPGNSDAKLVDKIFQTYSGKEYSKLISRGKTPEQFYLNHFQGTNTVLYNAKGWLNASRENQVLKRAAATLQESNCESISRLYVFSRGPVSNTVNSGGIEGLSLHRSTSVRRGFSTFSNALLTRSVCLQTKLSVDSLIERLRRTKLRFVHCLLPQHNSGLCDLKNFSPGETPEGNYLINVPLLRSQLRGAQILDSLRIHKQGFPEFLFHDEFVRQFSVLSPVDRKTRRGPKTNYSEVLKSILEHIELDSSCYRVGTSQIFFRSGTLRRLEEQREQVLSGVITALQAVCRGFLARKRLEKKKVQQTAIRCIQKNVRKFMGVRDWPWWRLLIRITPLLDVHRTEMELSNAKEELSTLTARCQKLEDEKVQLEHQKEKLDSRTNGHGTSIRSTSGFSGRLNSNQLTNGVSANGFPSQNILKNESPLQKTSSTMLSNCPSDTGIIKCKIIGENNTDKISTSTDQFCQSNSVDKNGINGNSSIDKQNTKSKIATSKSRLSNGIMDIKIPRIGKLGSLKSKFEVTSDTSVKQPKPNFLRRKTSSAETVKEKEDNNKCNGTINKNNSIGTTNGHQEPLCTENHSENAKAKNPTKLPEDPRTLNVRMKSQIGGINLRKFGEPLKRPTKIVNSNESKKPQKELSDSPKNGVEIRTESTESKNIKKTQSDVPKASEVYVNNADIKTEQREESKLQSAKSDQPVTSKVNRIGDVGTESCELKKLESKQSVEPKPSEENMKNELEIKTKFTGIKTLSKEQSIDNGSSEVNIKNATERKTDLYGFHRFQKKQADKPKTSIQTVETKKLQMKFSAEPKTCEVNVKSDNCPNKTEIRESPKIQKKPSDELNSKNETHIKTAPSESNKLQHVQPSQSSKTEVNIENFLESNTESHESEKFKPRKSDQCRNSSVNIKNTMNIKTTSHEDRKLQSISDKVDKVDDVKQKIGTCEFLPNNNVKGEPHDHAFSKSITTFQAIDGKYADKNDPSNEIELKKEPEKMSAGITNSNLATNAGKEKIDVNDASVSSVNDSNNQASDQSVKSNLTEDTGKLSKPKKKVKIIKKKVIRKPVDKASKSTEKVPSPELINVDCKNECKDSNSTNVVQDLTLLKPEAEVPDLKKTCSDIVEHNSLEHVTCPILQDKGKGSDGNKIDQNFQTNGIHSSDQQATDDLSHSNDLSETPSIVTPQSKDEGVVKAVETLNPNNEDNRRLNKYAGNLSGDTLTILTPSSHTEVNADVPITLTPPEDNCVPKILENSKSLTSILPVTPSHLRESAELLVARVQQQNRSNVPKTGSYFNSLKRRRKLNNTLPPLDVLTPSLAGFLDEAEARLTKAIRSPLSMDREMSEGISLEVSMSSPTPTETPDDDLSISETEKSTNGFMEQTSLLLSETDILLRKSRSGNSLRRSFSRDMTALTKNKLYEMTVDLADEQNASHLISERLQTEQWEKQKLQKEVAKLQEDLKKISINGDSTRLYSHELESGTNSHNGDMEDDEMDSRLYKRKYEWSQKEIELLKKQVQQLKQDNQDQVLLMKKQMEKKLLDTQEETEEQKQVAGQMKKKSQRLVSEMNDLKILLEDQTSRNNLLEKKQRRFDQEMQSVQEEMRKERLQKETAQRERDQALAAKYAMDQELLTSKLDNEMKEEKISSLKRELEELHSSGNLEEETIMFKKIKNDLELKIKDQEEELDELAGQVQILEGAKVRLEMSIEQMRKENKLENAQRDQESEEYRISMQKKMKGLENQVESHFEERGRLMREKHELERKLSEANEKVQSTYDDEYVHRLKKDLKKTKVLLRDTKAQLERSHAEGSNKILIRQLKTQLEDAEFSRTAALKGKQSAEADTREIQSLLEEALKAKKDAEDKCLRTAKEKAEIYSQMEENEEELTELMRKYKAAVFQHSQDQVTMSDQSQQIGDLEHEKQTLQDKLLELSSKVEVLEGESASIHTQRRLEMKVKEVESKLELEHTTRLRLESQISRLKDHLERANADTELCQQKEIKLSEEAKRLHRQLRELRDDLTCAEQKNTECFGRKQEVDKQLEIAESEIVTLKSDLKLAFKRIEDLQLALQGEISDSDSDVLNSDSDSDLSLSSYVSASANYRQSHSVSLSKTPSFDQAVSSREDVAGTVLMEEDEEKPQPKDSFA